MNEKALALSIIFLAMALIVPIYALYSAVNANIRNLVEVFPNPPDPDAVARILNEQAQAQTTILIIVIIAEVILVTGFAASFWYAIRCTKRDQCLNFPTP